MTLLALALWGPLAWLATWTVYSWYCLYRNYQVARTLGVPIRIIPIDHLNKLWLLVDKHVVSLVRRLPGRLGNNSFTRYNYRGWHEDDGLRSHDEMGDAWVLVTPCRNWLYLADPEALMNMYRRGKDFPRWVEITSKSIPQSNIFSRFSSPFLQVVSDISLLTRRSLLKFTQGCWTCLEAQILQR